MLAVVNGSDIHNDKTMPVGLKFRQKRFISSYLAFTIGAFDFLMD